MSARGQIRKVFMQFYTDCHCSLHFYWSFSKERNSVREHRLDFPVDVPWVLAASEAKSLLVSCMF